MTENAITFCTILIILAFGLGCRLGWVLREKEL